MLKILIKILKEVWLARNPPCFAFIVYTKREDAEKAIQETNNRTICGERVRVSWAKPRVRGGRGGGGGGGGRSGGSDSSMRCFACGERGHFSRECRRTRRRSRSSDDDDDRKRRRSKRSRRQANLFKRKKTPKYSNNL